MLIRIRTRHLVHQLSQHSNAWHQLIPLNISSRDHMQGLQLTWWEQKSAHTKYLYVQPVSILNHVYDVKRDVETTSLLIVLFFIGRIKTNGFFCVPAVGSTQHKSYNSLSTHYDPQVLMGNWTFYLYWRFHNFLSDRGLSVAQNRLCIKYDPLSWNNKTLRNKHCKLNRHFYYK